MGLNDCPLMKPRTNNNYSVKILIMIALIAELSQIVFINYINFKNIYIRNVFPITYAGSIDRCIK